VRRVGLLLLAGFWGGATSGSGQERAEPRLVLSLFGGVAAGGDLWEVNRQPFLVLGTELAPRYDTLRLGRRMNPAVMLGISGTVFRSAHVGISAEMVFLGLTTEDACTLVHETPGADVQRRNFQLCNSISSQSSTPTTVGFWLGATFRPAPRALVSPYGRLQAGVGAQSGSVIEMIGSFVDGGGRQQRLVIGDPSSGRITPGIGVAAGLMVPLGPGHQLRLELRDQVLFLGRVAGPATIQNPSATPTESFAFHSVGLTAGIDIVLEQRRGRRY
jgi:hypothetical protein